MRAARVRPGARRERWSWPTGDEVPGWAERLAVGVLTLGIALGALAARLRAPAGGRNSRG